MIPLVIHIIGAFLSFVKRFSKKNHTFPPFLSYMTIIVYKFYLFYKKENTLPWGVLFIGC